MPSTIAVRMSVDAPVIRQGLAAIAAELGLPSAFPPEVLAEAERAAAAVVLPELDRTDLPFITIDPAGSMDLDQAVHIERSDRGYVVHYAIADVAAFVAPGGAIDTEAHRRGETLYGAGDRIPLHPPALSEAAASLLPDQLRPALVWSLTLDADGGLIGTQVERAQVRSRRRWSYDEAQSALDSAAGEPRDVVLELVREVGLLLQSQERRRGGISLPLPEQEIDETDEGLRLAFRELLPVEEWNAQISLLTGRAAARLMLDAEVGLVRTLPPPRSSDVERLRLVAVGLRIDWPADQDYAWLVHSLDPRQPAHLAMIVACTRLLRGSGYAAFDGAVPEQAEHAAIAAPYAHATAPLRRLGDRYVGEVCLALCAGAPVPTWAREGLPELPEVLKESSRRASAYDRAILDLLEAAQLTDRVGEEFAGVVTSVRDGRPTDGVVVLEAIGVEAPISGSSPLPLGGAVTARLVRADVEARAVLFAAVGGPTPVTHGHAS